MSSARLEYLAKLALLAALYYLTGKFGNSIAIPPGYATVIWPPSGLALGALLAHGRRMSVGVFLGSLLYIVTYILVDVAYTLVDPRVRLS